MNCKNWFWVAVILCLMLGLAGCADSGASLWEQIQADGVLRVGTSADYPPWEYVDENGEFTGFDMDLAKNIGEHMGLTVEVIDIDFSALVAAVKEGKLHMGIGCMNATADRLKEVDFSEPYWHIISTPVIARDSDLVIEKMEDILTLKVGVQPGTTEEEWLLDQVESGKMEEENIFRYERYDQAMMDLVAGRLDAVLIEAITGKNYSKTMKIKTTIEEDISFYSVAIAIPKGEKELMEAINKAIAELEDQGLIEELAEKHFK